MTDPDDPVMVRAGEVAPDGQTRPYVIFWSAYSLLWPELCAPPVPDLGPPAPRRSLRQRVGDLEATVAHQAERVADLEQAVAEQIVQGAR